MLPFGTDQKSNPVGFPLIESTMLFGSLPGAGKTASLRCVVLGCALDPTVEMHVWELKGSGDLESLERIGYLDARDSDAVLAKPHAAREAAGLLTGQAADHTGPSTTATPARWWRTPPRGPVQSREPARHRGRRTGSATRSR